MCCGRFVAAGAPCPCLDSGRPSDAQPRDAGHDAGGASACAQGAACVSDGSCSIGRCITPRPTTLGSAADPIESLPSGSTTLRGTSWVGGYCTTVLEIPTDLPGACTVGAPRDVDDGCGACGRCVTAGLDARGVALSVCAAVCAPSATTNPCRPGYTCSFGLEACVPGCASDAECRVYRRDGNGNGVFDVDALGIPSRDGSGLVIDRLTYDWSSAAVCNTTTDRCDQPGAPSAVAGIACARDSDCEADGECFAQIEVGWSGGYCTKLGCDVAGRECAGAGSACGHNMGVAMCLQACTVGTEAIADRLGPSGHGFGCRPSYACRWNEVDGATPNNGACVPGNYNDVTTNNVGSPCGAASPTDDPDRQCYSPFGLGRCITPERWGGEPALPTGLCTVTDCGAPGIDVLDPCGSGAQCVSGGGSLSLCAKKCAAAVDCPTGYACGLVFLSPSEPIGVCTADCSSDGDCTPDRRCVIATGATIGRCVLR